LVVSEVDVLETKNMEIKEIEFSNCRPQPLFANLFLNSVFAHDFKQFVFWKLSSQLFCNPTF